MDPVQADVSASPGQASLDLRVRPGSGPKKSFLSVDLVPSVGTYLYRDRISVKPISGFQFSADPRMPPAQFHEDPVSGRVAVYRSRVHLEYPLVSGSALSESGAPPARVRVSYQSCSEAGVCFPPVSQDWDVRVSGAVAVPVAGGSSPFLGRSAPVPVVGPSVPAPPAPRAAVGPGSFAARVASFSGAFWFAMLLAFAGGAVLNLMPCVLPVVSIKALSLVSADPSRRVLHAWSYAFGVLASFAGIGLATVGLRQAGASLGWAFQMQDPRAVGIMALVILLMGLNLSGWWHMGGAWSGAGDRLTRGHGLRQDFFTGFLAVVVATPCIGPFMGSALAWSMSAPPLQSFAVFLALGAGLAFPVSIVGLVPSLSRWLPRPGAWMSRFRFWSAIPLYLTACWLVWVMWRQSSTGFAVLWSMLALSVSLWVILRARRATALLPGSRLGSAWAGSRPIRSGLASLSIVALGFFMVPSLHLFQGGSGSGAVTAGSIAARSSSVRFDESQISRALRAGHPVFVNVTADWCLTCKLNERSVLDTDGFRDAIRASGAEVVRGDYTMSTPEVSSYLSRVGAAGVPLYMVYRPDGSSVQLPQILTIDRVASELSQVRGPSGHIPLDRPIQGIDQLPSGFCPTNQDRPAQTLGSSC